MHLILYYTDLYSTHAYTSYQILSVVPKSVEVTKVTTEATALASFGYLVAEVSGLSFRAVDPLGGITAFPVFAALPAGRDDWSCWSIYDHLKTSI